LYEGYKIKFFDLKIKSISNYIANNPSEISNIFTILKEEFGEVEELNELKNYILKKIEKEYPDKYEKITEILNGIKEEVNKVFDKWFK
jgi:hypothetical protein